MNNYFYDGNVTIRFISRAIQHIIGCKCNLTHFQYLHSHKENV